MKISSDEFTTGKIKVTISATKEESEQLYNLLRCFTDGIFRYGDRQELTEKNQQKAVKELQTIMNKL